MNTKALLIRESKGPANLWVFFRDDFAAAFRHPRISWHRLRFFECPLLPSTSPSPGEASQTPTSPGTRPAAERERRTRSGARSTIVRGIFGVASEKIVLQQYYSQIVSLVAAALMEPRSSWPTIDRDQRPRWNPKVLDPLLRGTIVNRTYGINKNLYIYLFLLTIFSPINYGPP